MTETARHPKFRTLVASFLFTDLVGYSKGSAAEQYAAKDTLAEILRSNLEALQEIDYRIKDTGDGALIAFVSNPEHALYMALAIAEDFGRAAKEAGFPSNSLRTGIHLGSVKESKDMEARPNFVGDGINAAKRIMDFAEPGQITASRAFFEAVACLDSAYAELFTHAGAPDDKHGRAHDMYVIAPSFAVLRKLRLEIDAASRDATKIGVTATAPIKVRRMSEAEAAADAQARSSRAVARKAALPVFAVIVLGIALLVAGTRLGEPTGSKSPQATSAAIVAPAPLQKPVAPPTAAEGSVVGAQTSAAIPPKPEAAPPASAAPVAEASPAPDLTQPMTTPAAKAAKSSVAIKPRTDPSPPATVPADAASDRTSPRCSHIMEKATLGEALSTEEKRELANSCR